ncbi:ParB N-terminal domain-containing protein [Meridianimarinicoccus sp. RP-17]|uniref:ParB N-terminal domain-containing protein n=1 Tax=Meridianimarinicoccus zhengii TaxID=2056810 RepID=UPI000DAB7E44|nr:ParB N-terminal domain-containing protein [Phycocomes zhengii]
MTGSKNKFGFDPIDPKPAAKRERNVGPMGAAVREAAASLAETTEAKIEQRRKNAEDAKAWRAAEAQGRVLVTLLLSDVATDDLPRDRLDLEAVARSDEMEELKASIRARGQREPIEVYRDATGQYQLKKGWRRLTALKQLLAETGEDDFLRVVARVEPGGEATTPDRVSRYIDMVEENVVREDLTFAEMAQVAIQAARDPEVEGDHPDAMVGRLYASLHKMKRSYIRSFVFLLTELEGALKWPKAVSRNLGVDLARVLKAQPDRTAMLRRSLTACAAPEDQAETLAFFLRSSQKSAAAAKAPRERREKYEFHVGSTKVTARSGECRIVSTRDFADVPRDRLERAIRAFEAELEAEPPRPRNPRVTSL